MTDIVERLEDSGCDREPFTSDHANCKCHLAHEAAAEITRLRAAQQWRPMETAPKDGTEILVYRPDALVFTAQFVSPCGMGVGDDDTEAWFTSCGEDLTGDLPTHWMPLPSPPTKGGKE